MKRFLLFSIIFTLCICCMLFVSSCGADDSTTTAPDQPHVFDTVVASSKVVYGTIDYQEFNTMPSRLTIIPTAKASADYRFDLFYNKDGQLVRTYMTPLDSSGGYVITSDRFMLSGNGGFAPTAIMSLEHNENGDNIKISKGKNTSLLEYDNNNNLISITTNGVPKTKYEYDSNDNIIKIKTCQDEEEKNYSLKEITYSSNGLHAEIKTEAHEFGYVYFNRDVFEYNSSNQKTKHSRYDKNNKLVSYCIFEYEGNNCVKESYYDSEGELRDYNTYEYVNNVLVKESHFSSKNKLVYYSEHTADGALLKEYTSFNDDGSVSEGFEYTYDNNSRIVKKKFFGDIYNNDVSYEFRYDEKDKLTYATVYQNDKKLISVEYTYADNVCTNSKIFNENGSLIKDLNTYIGILNVENRKTPLISINYVLENENGVIEDYYLETLTIYSYTEYLPSGIISKEIRYSKTGEITFEYDYTKQ